MTAATQGEKYFVKSDTVYCYFSKNYFQRILHFKQNILQEQLENDLFFFLCLGNMIMMIDCIYLFILLTCVRLPSLTYSIGQTIVTQTHF